MKKRSGLFAIGILFFAALLCAILFVSHNRNDTITTGVYSQENVDISAKEFLQLSFIDTGDYFLMTNAGVALLQGSYDIDEHGVAVLENEAGEVCGFFVPTGKNKATAVFVDRDSIQMKKTDNGGRVPADYSE